MEKTLAFQLREEVRHAEATLPQLIQQELSAMEKRFAACARARAPSSFAARSTHPPRAQLRRAR
jgi:hypothetical protein